MISSVSGHIPQRWCCLFSSNRSPSVFIPYIINSDKQLRARKPRVKALLHVLISLFWGNPVYYYSVELRVCVYKKTLSKGRRECACLEVVSLFSCEECRPTQTEHS